MAYQNELSKLAATVVLGILFAQSATPSRKA